MSFGPGPGFGPPPQANYETAREQERELSQRAARYAQTHPDAPRRESAFRRTLQRGWRMIRGRS